MFFIYQEQVVSEFAQLPGLGMRALLLGESIFTSTRYQVGRPVAFWPDHLQRLAEGAAQLLGISGEGWERALASLRKNLAVYAQHVAPSDGADYYLRITGLATSNERSLWPSEPLDLVWLLVGDGPLPARALGAVRAEMVIDQRAPMPLKWGNYGPTIWAWRQCQEDCQDLLFVNHRGAVSECTTSNFFAIFPGPVIKTAPVGPGVFAGIYRKNLILRLRQRGHQVQEQSFSYQELALAQEAFTTNCVQGICAVATVFHRPSGLQLDFPNTIVQELQEWQNDV